MLGYALILIGLIFLMKALGLLVMINWDLVWPVALIAFGIAIVFNKKKW